MLYYLNLKCPYCQKSAAVSDDGKIVRCINPKCDQFLVYCPACAEKGEKTPLLLKTDINKTKYAACAKPRLATKPGQVACQWHEEIKLQ